MINTPSGALQNTGIEVCLPVYTVFARPGAHRNDPGRSGYLELALYAPSYTVQCNIFTYDLVFISHDLVLQNLTRGTNEIAGDIASSMAVTNTQTDIGNVEISSR